LYKVGQLTNLANFKYRSIAIVSITYAWHWACIPDGEEGMLRIQRWANGEVVFTLSGQMDEEAIAELETLMNLETNGRRMVLDLKDLTLVNEAAITFFVRCEANSITLKNCPAYVREWINAKRRER
jgi:hypothetical protein